jgi:TonB family protein
MLCLKNDKFLKIRRFYFLFTFFFSLLFPFFTIKTNIPEESPIPSYWLPQVETIASSQEISTHYINTSLIILIVLLIVTSFFLISLIIRICSTLWIRHKHRIANIENNEVIVLKDRTATPFSFFNWIFIPENTDKASVHEIITHEKEHARQLHSIDVLIYEFFCTALWWNPFAWLLRKEMKINLEYLADEGVLQKGFNAQSYQYILLRTSNQNTGISLVNNFNVSQLKKRIAMMNKKHTLKIFSTKYLLAIPVSAMLLLGNAVQASPELLEISTDRIENTLQQKKTQTPQKKGDTYVTVEKMPKFPGGEEAMQKFLADNLKYPVDAFEKGIQGRVTIRFVVSETGKIKDIELIRGIHESCDKEAMRVIGIMPDWTPGKQDDKNVSVYYTLPIVFKLNKKSQATPSQTSNNKAFMTVEQMPSFPGGEQAMMKYIGDNLKYPVVAQEGGIQGRVTVRFIISATGKISDIDLIRGISSECDQEAMRVIKAMPNWTPGKQNGKSVPVYFTLPIVFKLADETPQDNKA